MEGEGEEGGTKEEEPEDRMSYPGDQGLDDDSLQYRVQGSFQQHRYSIRVHVC